MPNTIDELLQTFERICVDALKSLTGDDPRIKSSTDDVYDPLAIGGLDWIVEDDDVSYYSDVGSNWYMVREIVSILAGFVSSARCGDLLELDQSLENLDRLRATIKTALIEDAGLDDVLAAGYEISNLLDNKIQFAFPSDRTDPTRPQIDRELFDRVLADPGLLFAVEPREFEELVARVVREYGYQASLTKRTRDGGYDIAALHNTEITNDLYLIECKRYSREKKVSVGEVRKLLGVKTHFKATKALLVTSSTFTRGALELARQHTWEIELRDYADLTNWLAKLRRNT